MNVPRRATLTGAVSLLALAACTTTGTTPAQVIADARGIVSALQTLLPSLTVADPLLLTPAQQAQVSDALARATALLATVTPSLPAAQGATTLQAVKGYINVALDAVSAVAGAAAGTPLAAYAVPIRAVIALVPVIEMFVNQTLGAVSGTAKLRARAVAPTMTPDAARAILGIRG